MDATVVIPNYNGIQYMDGCLEALYAGSVVPDILVVDNGSTDGSLLLVQEKYPAVRLITFSENTGFCRAVNTGIRATDSKYVILLNNDTRVCPHFVEQLVKAMEERPAVFSAGAKMLSMKEPDIIDDAGDLYCALGWAFARGKGKHREACPAGGRIFAACGGAAIYRRELLEKLGGFDENHFAYLEDIDIGYRARIAGYDNLFVPEAAVYHAGSAVSGSRHNAFKVRLSSRNSVYLVFKNMPLLQILLNLPFLLAGFCIKGLFFAKKGLGKIYVQGLAQGCRLSFSKEGRAKRVPFQWANFRSYCRIQVELWLNMLRRISG